ncbi:hypothetical protein FDA94_15865 [Herbidospora galbida]|uniref:Uncharacterized protein n=1 Tax=Herbidospora galbida TaxID=2575442 RepID=A0A4U3MF50_9ACTN|nr:DUF6461 domain-containing protein [Herbidospora galbida]TKK88028.1 hypothetical protein FDA94_15865 [Herbidospora galbida]
MSDVAHYLRLLEDQWELADWGTITWISGLEPADVLGVLGGDPSSGRTLSFTGAYDSASREFETRGAHCTEILLDRAGSWLVCIEPLGDEGSDPDTVSALSQGGIAFSLLLHPASSHRFTYAAGGETLLIVEWLSEPMISGPISVDEVIGDVPLLSEDLDSSDWQANVLALAEHITGFRLTTEWLGEEHPCHRNSRPALSYGSARG